MSFSVADDARREFNDAETASRDTEREIRFDIFNFKVLSVLSHNLEESKEKVTQ